jgi:hypothetical protein
VNSAGDAEMRMDQPAQDQRSGGPDTLGITTSRRQ